ncbi:excinuclease ABC subunit UvrC [Gleimia sp. 6138-11-ORH1]|uniref:excinuclease ABC subunit UvrC n=1 Tax=Gleimia sp. 6138-11-ORH1 TaxID=2973937 RepID=UPI002168BE7A|nr:excinuclease ABC subunit UvrC [Gleimia sp. 6138-11-ORH1]MCS4484319.1 excinuclease ABC subunit UvrC [Gleimia sp. 6138-11-ORH1]
MADPLTYRPKTSDIPVSPGVYRFSDATGRVIYVGKAKNLRNRLTSYFQDPANLHPRTQQMVFSATNVQWTVVNSEVEALTLEYNWIKEFDPRFNVMMKDDHSYPYLAVTVNEQIPRMTIMRGNRNKKVRYFGPYAQVWALRDTADQLQKVFQVRTCSDGVLRRAQSQGRPCLLGYIEKCSAPCTGKISEADYQQRVTQLCQFMAGKVGPYLANLRSEMKAAASELEFEKAARLRDNLQALEVVLERNAIVFNDGTDADVFGLVSDELESGIYLFHVRGGRIRGVRGWVLHNQYGASDAENLQAVLQQAFAEAVGVKETQKRQAVSVDDLEHLPTNAVPPEILVPVLPTEVAVLEEWLSEKRGAKVRIKVPVRGEKKALQETVQKNAAETLRQHRLRRINDLTQRSVALEELADYLELSHAPLRIECFDISHLQGTHQVGSLVVFEDGAPRKKDYRSFTIQAPSGESLDDTAAMRQVLTRRFKRLLAEENGVAGYDEEGIKLESGPIDETTGRPRRFSYRPDLVVVDGGLPQVNAAAETLTELGIDIPVIGLAKRLEEVWIPQEEYPVIFPRTCAGLYLLQHLRDESHRFAITAHRKKRSKSMLISVLDEIPGLGAAKQKALLAKFGAVKHIKVAKVSDLQEVAGIGPLLAQAIYDYFHPAEASVDPDESVE